MICYDISDDKRLRRVAKILEDYGLRIQKSFFQLDTDEVLLNKIINQILKELNLKYDYLFIYPLCEKCCSKTIKQGKGEIIDLEVYKII